MGQHHHADCQELTSPLCKEPNAFSGTLQHPRIDSLRNEMGDFGIALFCPLLNLECRLDLDKVLLSHNTTPIEETSCSESDDDEFGLCVVPEDVGSCPRLLTEEQMLALRDHLPFSLRDNVWERRFAISRDGDSFITLLKLCQGYKNTIVVIRSMNGDILGGFVNAEWGFKSKKQYYGSGQSFVFGTNSTDNDNDAIRVYRWTGENDYCQICDPDKRLLGMGGVGDFGWIVSDDFRYCRTGACATFGNPPLSRDLAFEIDSFECYGLKSPYWDASG